MPERASDFVRRATAEGLQPRDLREAVRKAGFNLRRVRLRGFRSFAPTVSLGNEADAFEVTERIPGSVKSLRALLAAELGRRKSTVLFMAVAGAVSAWAAACLAIQPGPGSAAAIVLLQLLRTGAGLRLSGRLTASLVPGVWGRVLRAGLKWFRGTTPESVALAGRATDPACSAVAEDAVEFATACLTAAAVAMALISHTGAPGIAIACAALALAAVRTALRCFETLASEASEAAERVNSGTAWLIVLDILNLRLLRAAERLAARYLAAHRKAVAERRREYRLGTWRCALAAATPAILLLPMEWTPDPAASCLAGAALLVWCLHAVDERSLGVFRLVLAARRLNPLLAAETEPEAPEKRGLRPRGGIRFEEVAFAWPGSDALALEGISLSIEPGEFVCLAGPSGSGKSTLIRLIMALETPTRGEILLDGQPLRSLDIETVRSAIETVTQEERLADGTIRNNILGASAGSLEDAWAAARLVCIDDAIRAMPLGMMTFANDRVFSTGERQRLFIARAIVNRPAILILDETLSGLDEETQCRIVANLRNVPGLTCIVASHRPSLAAIMDRTWRFERGRIVGVEAGRAVRAELLPAPAPPPEPPIFLPEAVERFHAPEPMDHVVRLWPW